ncbi:MAG TPA: class I SAM-dependent methyltransferase [Bacteroidales bacterium]|nr:class I SAM-dependent methyltransferase [Bacteroidales bacterium]
MRKTNPAAAYYDTWTRYYLETGYGDVIQAHRPPDVEQLFRHIINQTGITDGLKILDAGCGVCGPAAYFARHFEVEITSITNSAVQVEIARQKLAQTSLKGKINIQQIDFHKLVENYSAENFDLVLMLESFGHAVDKTALLKGVTHVLKKEGYLYIKDYFAKEITGSHERKRGMKRAIANMNKHYCYNLANLNHTIKTLRNLDLDIIYIMQNPLPIGSQDFVKDFEARHGIDIFEGGFHYLFLEPLELFFKKTGNIDRVLT